MPMTTNDQSANSAAADVTRWRGIAVRSTAGKSVAGHSVARNSVASTRVARNMVGGLTLALLAGCGGSSTSDPGGGQTPGTGGAVGITATGGSTASQPGGTGGQAGVTTQTGGSGPGPATGSGGLASSTGGATGRAGTGGAVGTSSGGTTMTPPGGSGGAPTGPIVAPVSDTASKVPVSNAPGYKVEANFAYGPLTAQRLDVIYPPTAGPKGTQVLPVVLMFHGGGWVHSYTNDYGSGKDHMTTFFDRFLAHGFMVCNAEYRVNDNTVDGAPAPAAAEDALLAAKWCWDHLDYFHGDKTRFVVTGASAGGHLALLVGMATPAAMLGPTSPAGYQVAAIVDGYGPADIEAELRGVAAGWFPANLPDRLAIAKTVNPMTYIRKDIPPMIVVQGSLDTTAPIGDSRRMVAMLKAAGADVTMHEVPGAAHGFATPASAWPDAEKAMFDWLTGKGIGK